MFELFSCCQVVDNFCIYEKRGRNLPPSPTLCKFNTCNAVGKAFPLCRVFTRLFKSFKLFARGNDKAVLVKVVLSAVVNDICHRAILSARATYPFGCVATIISLSRAKSIRYEISPQNQHNSHNHVSRCLQLQNSPRYFKIAL